MHRRPPGSSGFLRRLPLYLRVRRAVLFSISCTPRYREPPAPSANCRLPGEITFDSRAPFRGHRIRPPSGTDCRGGFPLRGAGTRVSRVRVANMFLFLLALRYYRAKFCTRAHLEQCTTSLWINDCATRGFFFFYKFEIVEV